MAADSPAELLLHPLRWRIVQAIAAAGRAAPRAVAQALPDVPTATLYRQLGKLAKGGVLVVVATRQARGANERIYALAEGVARLGDGPAAGATPDEHRRGFQAFTTGLIGSYERYLARGDVSPRRDGVGYHTHALWLSDDELEMVMEGIRDALAPALKYGPAPWRKPRLLSTVLMPAAEGAAPRPPEQAP